MTIEPRVIRTLKRSYSDDRFMDNATKRKEISDDILEIIYNKVKSKHDDLVSRPKGRGIKALISDEK